MLIALLALAATANAPPFAIPVTDACTAMIPPRLAAQLTRANSDYLLPQLVDAGNNRIKDIAERGAWPCPFVAMGDFDGDGTWDRALLLKHKSLPTVKLIAARNVNGVWQIELQQDLPIAIGAANLEPLGAGLYEQSKTPAKPGISAAAQLDNLVALQGDHAGFSVGQINDTKVDNLKVAYFFQNDTWLHLPIDD